MAEGRIDSKKNQTFEGLGLTDSQAASLEKFREIVADILKPEDDDIYLLRWLRARKFDVEKAEIMLRERIKFEKKMNIDALLKDYEPPEVFQKYVVFTMMGTDKNMNSLLGVKIGLIDYKGFAYSCTTHDLLKYVIYTLEMILDGIMQMQKNGKPGRKLTVVADFDQLNVLQLIDKTVFRHMMILLPFYNNYYPEVLEACYMINSPAFYNAWFDMIKVFIDPLTVSKIRFLPKDGFKDILLDVIDADVLPTFLGGTRTDPDGNPNCDTLFTTGRKIPVSYYLRNCDFVVEPGMKEIFIRARDSYSEQFEVEEPQSTIRWYFRTRHRDIKFGVFLLKKCSTESKRLIMSKKPSKRTLKTEDFEVVVKMETLEPFIVPEKRDLICENPGTYVLHFDNTYSWMTPKHLELKVELFLPLKIDAEV